MYIFISHSSKDSKIAQELCDLLEAKGTDCFLAPRDIRSGYEYAAEIAEGIDHSDGMLLILSEEANRSPHVLRELERAVTRAIPILVYKIDEVTLTKSMEYFLMTHQWMNAKENTYGDVVRSVEDLKNLTIDSNSTTKKKEVVEKKKIYWKVVLLIGIISLLAGFGAGLVSSRNQIKRKTERGNKATTIQLGDTISFGTYNDAKINWRVLKLSEDNTEAVLISEDVLTVKAYDAADSGKYNHDGNKNYYFENSVAEDLELQAYVRGNNSWENSNIRTWLNSDKENVTYEGQVPEASAMADGANGYHNEPGFLCGFTSEELAAIKESSVETKGNPLADTDRVVTQDKVFLLSMEELEWFEEANISVLAEPTPEAIEANGTFWYRDYCLEFGVKNHMWWLREPVEGSSSQCYLVGNGYHEENIYTWEVGVESFGIRPAIIVDLTEYPFEN